MRVDENQGGTWLSIFLILLTVPVSLTAQDAMEFFEENCSVCHTIGDGPLSGPDLNGVTQRRDRDWLIRFIRNPENVINSGDSYAKQILEASGGIVMPDFPAMTPELASALLDFIASQSKAGGPTPEQPSVIQSAASQEAATFFEENCTVCHTIGGGPLAGPDLRGVTQRKDRDWLIRFMRNPENVINSGDSYAKQILEASGGIVMPDFAEMTPELASALLDFMEASSNPGEQESQSSESPSAAVEISDRPFTPRDVEQGQQIFSGSRQLANGGPACFSCHAMRGFGGLGGGRLAPDLTLVYERMRGRKSLAAWLGSPPTTEMRSLFRQRRLEPEEIALLVAYFEDGAKRGGGEAESAVILGFFFLALGGTIVVLISLDAIWKRRLRAVREPLVRGAGTER
ncbi:MAG: cytochrome c [Acidobacteria bacterium]|nr:cytochrome c [Acidobacteriota bacterium]